MTNVKESPVGDDIAERTRKRVWMRLIPYLFFLYVLAYLDRVNVSVAQLDMQKSVADGGIGFDSKITGFGAGIFFWGYWILEIPSTISVLKWGARWVFVRILVLWGICCALVGAIGTPFASKMFAWVRAIPLDSTWITQSDAFLHSAFGTAWGWLFRSEEPIRWISKLVHFYNGLPNDPEQQFYFFRFMLGFFEGGFFPSVILYLSLWFRAADRAKAIASFMAAIPLSSMFGTPLSGLMLKIDWFDLPGWRWIFILQGIAPVLAGFVTIFMLPDNPNCATWLPADERDWLNGELEKERQGKVKVGRWAWLSSIWLVGLLTVVYFCQNVTSYGLGMFLPAIIKSQMGTTSNLWASVVTGIPYGMAFVFMLINGWHSDKTGERIGHVAISYFGLSLGVFLASYFDGRFPIPLLAMILIVGPCMYAHLPAFWPIPTMFLGSRAAASAIGFINMIGNIGGFFGPVWVGASASQNANFADGLRTLSIFPLVAAAIILSLGMFRKLRPLSADPKNG